MTRISKMLSIKSELNLNSYTQKLVENLGGKMIDSNAESTSIQVGSKIKSRLLGYNSDRVKNRIPFVISIKEIASFTYEIRIENNPGYYIQNRDLYPKRTETRLNEIVQAVENIK